MHVVLVLIHHSLPLSVAASDQEEEEEEEEEGEKEPTAAPTQPSLGVLSASDVTHDSVHLAWTVPHGDFDSFTVQYKDAEEKPQALPVDGGTHTITILNLTPSHRYKFHLYGISGQKRLGPISTDTVTGWCLHPGVPSPSSLLCSTPRILSAEAGTSF